MLPVAALRTANCMLGQVVKVVARLPGVQPSHEQRIPLYGQKTSQSVAERRRGSHHPLQPPSLPADNIASCRVSIVKSTITRTLTEIFVQNPVLTLTQALPCRAPPSLRPRRWRCWWWTTTARCRQSASPAAAASPAPSSSTRCAPDSPVLLVPVMCHHRPEESACTAVCSSRWSNDRPTSLMTFSIKPIQQ